MTLQQVRWGEKKRLTRDTHGGANEKYVQRPNKDYEEWPEHWIISDKVYVITVLASAHHEFQHDQQFQEPTERVELWAGTPGQDTRACCPKENQNVRISSRK